MISMIFISSVECGTSRAFRPWILEEVVPPVGYIYTPLGIFFLSSSINLLLFSSRARARSDAVDAPRHATPVKPRHRWSCPPMPHRSPELPPPPASTTSKSCRPCLSSLLPSRASPSPSRSLSVPSSAGRHGWPPRSTRSRRPKPPHRREWVAPRPIYPFTASPTLAGVPRRPTIAVDFRRSGSVRG